MLSFFESESVSGNPELCGAGDRPGPLCRGSSFELNHIIACASLIQAEVVLYARRVYIHVEHRIQILIVFAARVRIRTTSRIPSLPSSGYKFVLGYQDTLSANSAIKIPVTDYRCIAMMNQPNGDFGHDLSRAANSSSILLRFPFFRCCVRDCLLTRLL